MNNEDILKALSDVDPEMLRECSVVRKSQARRANPAVFLLVAASLLLIGVAAIVLSVRYRGRTTADTPEDESASSLSETAESAGEEETNTSRKPHENELVYEQEITLTIPNDGRVTTNMTIEFSDGYPIREAVRKAGYENFSDASDAANNALYGYEFLPPSKINNAAYDNTCRYTFREPVHGHSAVVIGEESIKFIADLDVNNGGYTEGMKLDFCLESETTVLTAEGSEKPVIIRFIVYLKAPEEMESISCFHMEVPVVIEDGGGRTKFYSTFVYPTAVKDFMKLARTEMMAFSSVQTGAADPCHYGSVWYNIESSVISNKAAEGEPVYQAVFTDAQDSRNTVSLYLSEGFCVMSGELGISPEDYDPEGILRFEVAAQIKSSKAVLFTIDILPEMEKDVKEEIPSVFSVETSESVPPAVSDYMKNNRDQILSILNAEGHAAPADPDEIYIMEPFVVDEDGAVTGQKKKTVCEDYYYPVISGGHLYAVLKCSIPETTNLTRFTQLYSQRKIRLEEDENMLWYLSRPDNEKLLFEGEGWRYRVVHHYGFDYSHFYALRATKFSDGTSVKVFMDLK